MGSELLQFALHLADLADPIAMAHLRQDGLKVQTKSDQTPVTLADQGIERLLRQKIAKRYPDHSAMGEEYGEEKPTATRWIIDPIDATANFIRGIPVFGLLLAVEQNGQLEAAVVSAPAMTTRWWAARGHGAFRNGQQLHVSTISDLVEAQLSHSGLATSSSPVTPAMLTTLAQAVARNRGFGDFWSFMLVAEGAMDIAIECKSAKLWDVAAPALIVREAGGQCTDAQGQDRLGVRGCVATNGRLHQAVLKKLMA